MHTSENTCPVRGSLPRSWYSILGRLFFVPPRDAVTPEKQQLHGVPEKATVSKISFQVPSRKFVYIDLDSVSSWSRTSGHCLQVLLREAQYSPTAIKDAMRTFDTTMAPNMGAMRSAIDGSPAWKSFMCDDHSPIELSWDWGDGRAHKDSYTSSFQTPASPSSSSSLAPPQVRYSIEPINPAAGTSFDPFNSFAAERFHSIVSGTSPRLDQTWYRHFWSLFNNQARSGLASNEGHSTEAFYAFDLKHGGRADDVPKAYFFPAFYARRTGCSNLEAVVRALASAPACDPVRMGLPALQDFLAEMGAKAQVEMLAIDMLAPSESRVKVYFRVREVAFESVERAMTLGGRVKGCEAGIERLRMLWDEVFEVDSRAGDGLRGGDDGRHRTAGMLYNVELRPDGRLPTVKVYLPVRHYARSDEAVLRGVERFMRRQRRDEWVPAYRRVMMEVFNQHSLHTSCGVHTYLGCSILGDGSLRVVSYINVQKNKMRSTRAMS